jgi:frataxin-like iron-binding protein CyaY
MKDVRKFHWKDMEKDIQKVSNNKDKKFVLKGKWKKYVKTINNYKIYAIDQKWINNNLSVTFHHGGHGLVHEFIPLDEIWISTHHYNCKCKKVSKDKNVSKRYFESTLIHELVEVKLMKKGMNYWQAHNVALQKELSLELLPNPYTEKYD